MVPLWWSVLLAAVGVVGAYIAGNRRHSHLGWIVGVAAQLLWIAYAIATSQWAFIASALVYGGVYARNALRNRPGRDQ